MGYRVIAEDPEIQKAIDSAVKELKLEFDKKLHTIVGDLNREVEKCRRYMAEESPTIVGEPNREAPTQFKGLRAFLYDNLPRGRFFNIDTQLKY